VPSALLLLLWILGTAGTTAGEETGPVLRYLSVLTHYEALLKGVFDTRDVVYYLLFTLTCLVLAIRRLDADRLRG